MQDIERFIGRFREFKANNLSDERGFFADLVRHGQHPKALVIACCDSRVDPAILTNSDLGELFVIRNVANLVPPYMPHSHYAGTQSGIEYAVRVLNVEHIILLGHSHCGGIQALMDPCGVGGAMDYICNWVSIVEPAWRAVQTELAHKPRELQARACELAALLTSLEHLGGYPWIQERVEQQRLSLHAWYFDLDSRELFVFDHTSRQFCPVA